MRVAVRLKRIYEPPEPDDGYRVLIDGMWPRGVAKADAHLDEWARDLAPSRELRTWFGHKPERFQEFRTRYRRELEGHADHLAQLRERAASSPLTVLYAARDTEHNNAVVVGELLRSSRGRSRDR